MGKRKALEVIHSNREIIEGKLLTALDDDDKVAVLLNKDNCDMLIAALHYAPSEWVRVFRQDLIRLCKEAFGDD